MATKANCASAVGPGHRHQRVVAHARADQRHHALNEREPQRQHQRVMADLGDHFFFPYSSFQWPCFFSASATSLGM